MPRGRISPHGLPPGIQKDKHGALWATLEGDEAKRWKERYPDRARPPRRRAKDMKQAIRLQRELIRDLDTGRDTQAENPIIAILCDRWIEERQKISTTTRKRYRQSLIWQIRPLKIGRLRVRQLAATHIRDWVRQLLTHPRQNDPDRMLDAYTVRNAFAVLRGALNQAVRDGLIPQNPCKGIELPEPDDEEIHPLTVEQVIVFLALVDAFEQGKPHRLAALYHIAIRCGLRMAEIIGLRWIDVDLERRELRITGQHKEGRRKRGKTPKAHRTVPLTADLVAILRIHLANQIEEKNVAGKQWNSASLVFCSEVGTPIGGTNLWRQYTWLLRTAGLADPCTACNATGKLDGKKCGVCHGNKSIALFRFHDLRHTYAALAIAASVDIYTLSRRMGHESINTTADRYGHLYKGRDDDAHAIEKLIKRGEI